MEALRGIGQVEYERGNPQGSLDYLNRALSLAVEVNNRQGKAAVLHDLEQQIRSLAIRSDSKLQSELKQLLSEMHEQLAPDKGTLRDP